MASRSRLVSFLLSVPFLTGIFFGAVTAGAVMRGSVVFQDVPSGAFYDDAVGQLYAMGIIKGTDSTHFNPDDYVTRGQIAVLFQRFALQLQAGATLPAITNQQSNQPASGSSSSSSATFFSSSSSSTSSSSSSSSTSSTSGGSPVKLPTISGAGSLRFTTDAISTIESASKVSVSVIRDGGSKGNVSVEYTTADGNITAGTNYMANHGTLTFADGVTSQVITVSLHYDKLKPLPGNGTFKINLSNVSGGAGLAAPNSMTITLLAINGNNSVPGASSSSSVSSISGAGYFEFSAGTYAVPENGGTVTITVNRISGSAGAATVNYATSDNTALVSKDYTAATGTLSFAAGETSKTFNVTVLNNNGIEGNRKVNLTLSAPTGGAGIGTRSSAPITIVDEDSGASGSGVFLFSTTSVTTTAGATVTLTVNRTGDSTPNATVKYTTSDGLAGAGTDYAAANGTLTFLPGEMSKTIQISILTGAKSGRAFTVMLSSATNATVSPSDGNVGITIQ